MRVPNITPMLFSAVIAVACRTVQESPNPFTVPPEIFYDSVGTVVVASASVVGDIEIADSALMRIETAIENRLDAAGLTVVPAAEYSSTWERIVSEAGALFDPFTGERNEATFGAAVELLHAELEERFGFDAILYPEVWEVVVPFDRGTATWGGVERLIVGGRGRSGEVRASTLYIVVQDKEGNELYANEAGLQVLEYVLRGQLTPLQPERLIDDTTRTVAAVWQALEPLIIGRSASSTPRR